MNGKTLSSAELEELGELIDSIDHRLTTSNFQMLARAKHGSSLSPANSVLLILDRELSQVRRIRDLLGLPVRNRGDRSQVPADAQGEGEEPLREQLVRKGIEPESYRNMRVAREKRAARKLR